MGLVWCRLPSNTPVESASRDKPPQRGCTPSVVENFVEPGGAIQQSLGDSKTRHLARPADSRTTAREGCNHMMATSGETNLATLIKSMQPILQPEIFVYAQLPLDSKLPFPSLADKNVKMLFRESERWTIILPAEDALQAKLDYAFSCRQITLNVHSSLDAVGFLAAITTRLAQLNIGVNPVSAYLHDHLFVPAGSEKAVLDALQAMIAER